MSHFSSNQQPAAVGTNLWGGRFTGETDPIMEKFNNSINYDKIMWREDLFGSEKYALALEKCDILTKEEASEICRGLKIIQHEWEGGIFELKTGK